MALDVVAVGREDRDLVGDAAAAPAAGHGELLGLKDVEAQHADRGGEGGDPVGDGLGLCVPAVHHRVPDGRVGKGVEPGPFRGGEEPLSALRRGHHVVEEGEARQAARPQVIHRHRRDRVLVVGHEAEAVVRLIVQEQDRRPIRLGKGLEVGGAVDRDDPVGRVAVLEVGADGVTFGGKQDLPGAMGAGVLNHPLDHGAVIRVARVQPKHHPRRPGGDRDRRGGAVVGGSAACATRRQAIGPFKSPANRTPPPAPRPTGHAGGRTPPPPRSAARRP